MEDDAVAPQQQANNNWPPLPPIDPRAWDAYGISTGQKPRPQPSPTAPISVPHVTLEPIEGNPFEQQASIAGMPQYAQNDNPISAAITQHPILQPAVGPEMFPGGVHPQQKSGGAAPVEAAPAPLGMKGPEAQQMFQDATGRAHGSVDTDLEMLGRGDITFPEHVTPDTFANEVQAKVDDVKRWNRPDWRYWYENSGKAINTSAGGDPNMSDRVTATVSKTSQSTPVQDNAAYTARAHNQAMVGDPISAGRYPNEMGKHITGYYNEPNPDVVGPKITGYQSGFRTWAPDYKNLGANDIWNMRWLGFKKGAGSSTDGSETNVAGNVYKGTPTTSQHNYDRLLRSAVTQRLNDENFDGGGWMPGQVQAVGWGGTQVAHGVKPDDAGADIGGAFNVRTARLHYESAPGLTTNHFPEYHNAPDNVKQEYHDAINQVLMDPLGRDLIASHMGLLTQPTEHGVGVFQGKTSPGSAARVVTGNAPGGWQAGYDPATAELMKGAELTRGLLLRQDAVAGHYPQFPGSGLTKNNANLADVRTGSPMTPEEGKMIAQHMSDVTGNDFFSPIFTQNGYRFVNEPTASGMSNPAFQKSVVDALNRAYPDKTVEHVRGASVNMYQPNDWSAGNGAGYLQGLRSLRPDVQRRASELLATLGPKVSAVENQFAAKYGWTANPATRVWESNPAYKGYDTSAITPGVPPQPWNGSKRDFNQSLLQDTPMSQQSATPWDKFDRAQRLERLDKSINDPSWQQNQPDAVAFRRGEAAYLRGQELPDNEHPEFVRGYKNTRKDDRFAQTIYNRANKGAQQP